ncbi:hypothetical protein BDR05DRAFT_969566 [Suillus weaverae]|nr:hypothetical protein BDR05DRAFT_969566 [Suillus weaverae]
MSPAGETGISSTPPRTNAPADGASKGNQCHEFKIKDEELGMVDLLLHTSHDERATHYGLQGWATNVVPVTSEALAKKYNNLPDGMVAKIFLGEANRTSELEILKRVEENPGRLTLWKEGVYHRDISPGNLMWYRRNGKLISVLNDYDLSSLANVVGPQGNESTGTVLFMVLDLLTAEAQRGEVKHLYRHDLESFMWVFAWIFLRYRQGVLLPAGLRMNGQLWTLWHLARKSCSF